MALAIALFGLLLKFCVLLLLYMWLSLLQILCWQKNKMLIFWFNPNAFNSFSCKATLLMSAAPTDPMICFTLTL